MFAGGVKITIKLAQIKSTLLNRYIYTEYAAWLYGKLIHTKFVLQHSIFHDIFEVVFNRMYQEEVTSGIHF
ncbi:MAG TPA: hypothetical protein DCE41_06850 [Cytophagales bacterium]|nr:hypothetical protein [Cytophagales bacterium]HAA19937.1 hypothetical protein [Cytophagales bacterium]